MKLGGEVARREPHKLKTAGSIPAPAIHLCQGYGGQAIFDEAEEHRRDLEYESVRDWYSLYEPQNEDEQ